jgi:hypothetical protein
VLAPRVIGMGIAIDPVNRREGAQTPHAVG